MVIGFTNTRGWVISYIIQQLATKLAYETRYDRIKNIDVHALYCT